MEVITVTQCIVNIHVVGTSAAVYVYLSRFLVSINYTHFISLIINSMFTLPHKICIYNVAILTVNQFFQLVYATMTTFLLHN